MSIGDRNSVVLILCSGQASRWNNYLGIPKQHITVNNETLIERTLRLLRKHAIYNDIYIVSDKPEIKNKSCDYFCPESSTCTAETIYSTRMLWKQQTIILLGDVLYSENAINSIINCKKDLCFFGKPRDSKFFGSAKHGEILGLSFRSESHKRLENSIKLV